ncbi:MAG: heme A synthase, partial [Flavobacterium sp.]
FDGKFTTLISVALALSLIQIVLGTQVRQFVDEQVKVLGDGQIGLALQNPDVAFYIHRSFSLLVLLVNVFLFIRNRKLKLGFGKMNWVISLIGLEIATGVIMFKRGFPLGSQAAHLVIASLLFGMQFYLLLEAKSAKNTR